MYPPAGFVPETTLASLPPVGKGIIPSLSNNKGPERSISFKDSLADLSDGNSIDSPNIPPESHYKTQPPKRALAFQLPFKLCASRTSAREAHDKKDNAINSSKKKKKEDELFILNALETDNRFKVACSVAALLLFFHDKDFKGGTTRGEVFEKCDKYRPAPLSDMWLNILLKHRSAHDSRPPRSQTFPLGRRSTFPAEHVPHRHHHGQVPPGPLRLQSQASPYSRRNEIPFHVLPRPSPAT
jgi:hypothetical protein